MNSPTENLLTTIVALGALISILYTMFRVVGDFYGPPFGIASVLFATAVLLMIIFSEEIDKRLGWHETEAAEDGE